MPTRRTSRWLSTCFLTVIGTSAGAETAPVASGSELAEIVVTAQKREENLQHSAESITVLTGQDLTARGAESFEDYIAGVPGLTYTAKSPGDQVFAIRGVSDNASTMRNTQMTTGVYVDEVVVSNNNSSPDLHLFDIDRVEVLRGPQGTLYGDGSIGGVVRILTNKADPTNFHASVASSVSDTQNGGINYSVDGMINLPIKEDVLGLRIVGYRVSNGGFIDNITTGQNRANDEHTTGGRVSLRLTPNDNLSVTLNLLYQDMELGSRNLVQIVPDIGDLTRATPTPSALDYKYGHVALLVDGNLGFADITSASTFSQFKRNDRDDFTDGVNAIIGIRLPTNTILTNDTKSWSEEVRLSSHAGGPVDWLAGAYFFHLHDDATEFDTSQGLDALLPAFGVPPESPLDLGDDLIFRGIATSSRDLVAGFGDLTYHFSDQWSATVGGRWSHEKLSSTNAFAGLAFGSPPYTNSLDTSASRTTGRVRLAYQATANALFYAQASEGYRIGGLNPLTPASANNPNFPKTFQSDSLRAYELGWKLGTADKRLTLDGALFKNNWNNVQLEQTTPDGFSFIGNGGRAHTQGVEIELVARPINNLEFSVGGSVLQAQLDEDVPALGAHRGDPLPGVSRENGNVAVQYTTPVTADYSLFARTDAVYTSKTHLNFGESDDTAGDYALINLRLGIKNKDLTVALFANNLANRRADLSTTIVQNPAIPFYRKFEDVSRPRTIGVSAQYTW
jgi:outer membrane receptor protein involved in Fe transport